MFLNGELLFHGMSGYRQRNPSFRGAIGLNDAVYLPLNNGDNELLLVITEAFGGWGLICGDGEAVYRHDVLREAWTTEDVFLIPETVVYDPARRSSYVSNNDMFGRAAAGGQFISKVSSDGSVVELEWAKGLYNPVGMAVDGDRPLIGNNGDNKVKIVDLGSKKISTLVELGAGIIDGIEVDNARDYLVSQWEGKLYKVSPSGQATKLLDTTVTEINCANFAYVPEKGLIVVPTFRDNRVEAYEIVD